MSGGSLLRRPSAAIELLRRIHSLDLALRFLRGGRGSVFGSSTGVALGGLALGVASLVVAMGLMSGYRRDLADSLVAVNAEILLVGREPGQMRTANESREAALRIAGVEGVASVVLQPCFARAAESIEGAAVTLKGIDPAEGLPRALAERVPALRDLADPPPGELPPAVVGEELARKLGVSPGHPFRLLLPDFSAGGERPRTATFRLRSTFRTGFAQYDSEWIFVPLGSALRALRLGGPTAVEVRLVRGAPLEPVRAELARTLPSGVRAIDWRSINRQLFAALSLQQRALFFALALIVGVAAFNLAASLRTLAASRSRDVGLLVAVGARSGFVTRVFLWCGLLLGTAGTAAGLVGGVLLCLLLTATRAIRFGPEISEIYFVSWIPFRPEAGDLLLTGLVSIILSLGASIGPARRAARTTPAEALRQE